MPKLHLTRGRAKKRTRQSVSQRESPWKLQSPPYHPPHNPGPADRHTPPCTPALQFPDLCVRLKAQKKRLFVFAAFRQTKSRSATGEARRCLPLPPWAANPCTRERPTVFHHTTNAQPPPPRSFTGPSWRNTQPARRRLQNGMQLRASRRQPGSTKLWHGGDFPQTMK